MKKSLFIFTCLLAVAFQSSAHYLWLETAESGEKNKEHVVEVYFGEYTYGVIENPNGENFAKVKNFSLWVISPSGKKTTITTSVKGNAFQGIFTPKENGTYTVVLNNNEIDVIDYTKYDFGIFKTHYHSTAKVVVGDKVDLTTADNNAGLVVVNASSDLAVQNSSVELQVLYKGKPLAGQEVDVYVADLWTKKLKTDEHGKVSFSLPWKTKYTVETTKKEDFPGTYKGEGYQFIWHCTTYCIAL
ncbi:DUF4198 domain-containing protein [Fulvivirga sp. 29W222]|uniref:DUF4198 domain-containing protein n=1 Tax=Fulvivirga marina TaxID=2494733 RepID=A0A937G0G5_9BACT|nr:DUF4198 domain-containing protein [Fulvivirga marina]MBL6447720.1 DUF4198 domain-containing protein [Fulvivirga marina]